MTGSWAEWAHDQTRAVRAQGRWRSPRDFDATGPEGALAPEGRGVVTFASNDYLGLTQHPEVVAAAHAALDRWGAGAGSARLIVGSRPVHTELEHALAEWKRCDAAALFPTGFAANLGALATIGTHDTLLCSDELNHASIIDGCRAAAAEVVVYRHRDIGHLTELIATRGAGRRIAVVTDSVFSMDGTVAPVDELVACCRAHGALLVLDEAHAVLGPDPDLTGVDAVRIGTLSKTLGALGGYVAGPQDLVDLVVNRARSYIFTTAPTPADTAAALAALRIVRNDEGRRLVARLAGLVERFRPGHPSPIIPVVCGDEAAAVAAAADLLEHGLLVPAIRPPTVAPGSCRLRVTLSAAHTDAQVDRLIAGLAVLGLA